MKPHSDMKWNLGHPCHEKKASPNHLGKGFPLSWAAGSFVLYLKRHPAI